MASTDVLSRARMCDLCARIPWYNLPAEDINSTPHHKTRSALEESSKTCTLCKLVLRSAIANYTHPLGTRYNRGYWRDSFSVKLETESGERTLSYSRFFGACRPEAKESPAGVFLVVIAPTGNIDGDYMCTKRNSIPPDVAFSELEDSTRKMPAWVYGNWWADAEPGIDGNRYRRLVGIGARFGSSPSPYDGCGLEPGHINLCGSTIGICTTDDNSTLKHIPGRLREIHSDSEIAYFRLQQWLSECINNHPSCGTPGLNPELPTRVIDVFAYDRGVSLLQSSGQRGKYIALSHCWGTSARILNTKETLEDLQEGIAISFLPKTFQDAIKITKLLNIKYLWIDCLCIIQDDPLDWEKEASCMAQVYQNAYLTIAAAASRDSYSGCFPVREKDTYISPPTRSLGYENAREASGEHSCTLELPITAQPEKRDRMYLFEEWLPGSSFYFPHRRNMGAIGKQFDPIDTEPLSGRGWTLQERLLSPRTIHYATDQIYFECERQLASEDGFVFPSVMFNMKNLVATQLIPFDQHGVSRSTGMSLITGQSAALNRAPGRRWEGGWLSIVENYSKRYLTHDQDKLSALAGVARALADTTGDRYYAGLWGEHLPEDLHWCVYTEEKRSDSESSSASDQEPLKAGTVRNVIRPARYRAPSWSWASIDAPIKYNPLSYSNLLAHIMNCETTPAGIDEFGRVSSGKLEIVGPIWEIRPHQPKEPWYKRGTPVEVDLKDDRGTCIGEAHLDDPIEPLPSPCYALFLDPANSLIIKGIRPKACTDGHVHEDLRTLSAAPIMTTDMVNLAKRRFGDIFGQANAFTQAIRIGVGAFVANARIGGSDKEKWPQDGRKYGGLDPWDIWSVNGDESWGPVTKGDAKISIAML